VTARRHTPPTSAGRLARLSVVACLLLAFTAQAEDHAAGDRARFAFDKDRLYVRWILDLQPLQVDGEERAPYEDVLLHAHGFTGAELLDAARRDVSVGDMMDKEQAGRDEVRFELVHIEGKLKRLKRIPSLPRLTEAGITELYEAWVFPRAGRATEPVCVILSQIPAGLEPADDYTPGVPVSTAGYFFKVISYKSNQPSAKDSDGVMTRRAPLLLGQTLTTTAEPRADNASISDLLTVSVVFGGAVLVGVLGLALWFRRSDVGSRRASVNRLRNPYTPPPDATDEPPAGPPTT
jgi:hypothetical protein